MTRPARALIDLQALQSNFRRVRSAAPHSRIMAVVKSNGYGHGLIRVAKALPSADAFAVACLEEAMELREAGVRQTVVLLEGFFEPQELESISRLDLELVVHHASQLEVLEKATLAKPVSVWLKIDTGMYRLGFMPENLPDVLERLGNCSNVAEPLRFLSHLACADDRDSNTASEQLAKFIQVTKGLEGERSLANSAGLLAWPKTHLDWVRPGIMLYGASPLLGNTADDLGLQPVMTLTSRLIAVKHCQRGDAVGYGGDWVCPEDMLIGVAAIGYGDGYPRHAPSSTPVLVNGQQVSLIGRVSMDMIILDLRSQPTARAGDAVQLWGPDLPVDDVAHHAGTIAYELFCGVTARVAVEVIEVDKR
ncbi:MAG: alanine racemase [Gammaproteobacteria bacterium]